MACTTTSKYTVNSANNNTVSKCTNYNNNALSPTGEMNHHISTPLTGISRTPKRKQNMIDVATTTSDIKHGVIYYGSRDNSGNTNHDERKQKALACKEGEYTKQETNVTQKVGSQLSNSMQLPLKSNA